MTAHAFRTVAAICVLLSVTALVPSWGAEPPAPRPDKALVYFARAGRFTGSARSIFLFSDKTFLGVLWDCSYGFAYVEPGRHLFWTTFTKATQEFDLVPGETYYLEIWNSISTLDASRGEALIEEVGDLVVPDADDRERAAKYISRKYDRAVETEGKKEKFSDPLADVKVQAASPGDREGKLKIPAYTKGLLEFLESVTTEFTPAGSFVQFRLVEDVIVNGEVVVRAGTPVKGMVRQSSPAGGYGKAGTIEVSVPSLKAANGALVPLVAQLVASGPGRKENAAAAAGIAAGPLAGLAVRGREAFYLAGERLTVWTREDAWIPHTTPAPAATPEPAADAPPASSAVRITATCPDVVHFNPTKRSKPYDVKFVLVTDAPPAEVAVTRVADFTLPFPLPMTDLVRSPDGWQCTYDGWELVRYLRVGHETDPQPVVLRGHFDDGREFTATVPVLYEVER